VVKFSASASHYMDAHAAIFFASGMKPFPLHACTHSDSEKGFAPSDSFRCSSINILNDSEQYEGSTG
jgi:hypothetical protein